MLTRRDICKALAAIPVVGWFVPKAVAKPIDWAAEMKPFVAGGDFEPVQQYDFKVIKSGSVQSAEMGFCGSRQFQPAVQVNPGDRCCARFDAPSGKITLLVYRVDGRVDAYPSA